MENLKRSIKSQGSKKININCTSHIVLIKPLDEGTRQATVYKKKTLWTQRK